jgi:translation initiation factor 1
LPKVAISLCPPERIAGGQESRILRRPGRPGIFPECSKPVDACICKQTVIPAGDGIARVRRESKGRGGKTVTTITGVPLAEDALKELATTLKKRCGTGGALKDGIIEIQGDHVELLLAELVKHGFKAKKSGG